MRPLLYAFVAALHTASLADAAVRPAESVIVQADAVVWFSRWAVATTTRRLFAVGVNDAVVFDWAAVAPVSETREVTAKATSDHRGPGPGAVPSGVLPVG